MNKFYIPTRFESLAEAVTFAKEASTKGSNYNRYLHVITTNQGYVVDRYWSERSVECYLKGKKQ